jgi:hypothetical protein
MKERGSNERATKKPRNLEADVFSIDPTAMGAGLVLALRVFCSVGARLSLSKACIAEFMNAGP